MSLFVKTCPSCHKGIPSRIEVCPYCRNDVNGQPVPSGTQGPREHLSMNPSIEKDLECLNSDDPFVRDQAVHRLGQRGPSVVPFLVEILSDQRRRGLPDAAKLLGRLRDRRALPALAQAMKMGDQPLKAAAVWALSQFRDPELLPELIAEAELQNPEIQSFLAHTLGTFQTAQVVPTLAKLARSDNVEVAFQAVYALGESGMDSAVEPLQHALRRKNPSVRTAAAAALRRLGVAARRPSWGLWCTRWVLAIVGLSGLAVAVWHFYK